MGNWVDVGLIAVLNGVAIGLLLFIVAIGLSLVFGMMDVLNLAHGALFLAGAYLAWSIVGDRPTWIGWLAALAVAAAVGALAGGGLSLLTAPLAGRTHLEQALLTLGVALVGAELLSAAFGDDVRGVNPPPGLDGTVSVVGNAYPTYRLALIGVGAGLALALHLVIERTPVGALVRASVADRDMVAAVGIDVRRVRAGVFVAGSVLAVTAGVLGSPIYNARPGLDSTMLILALLVVVVGGLGSVRGALVAALLIGQIESTGRIVLSDLASFLLFGVLALVLVVRPRGLAAAPSGHRS
ncbi:branched-chain amino acid ABC transporter permease [Virgisporangium aurantiacum]|uniref:Branched-chain amino acid ABC transporter permease n=1 Tax=Virgisporangium aurantiacum TaxID=175570 RepID=A0A8J3Z3K0_9ACTN|nr:branched-chain amino acid ABC transporter permease [Virgisporangium aurantiacum]GIJ56959.1 branched-chain amino acid ABC transporter permease [Virgisporangium aurantiacum]